MDTFSGDWKTTAIGTCTDFNVMTSRKLQSYLYHISMAANSNHILKTKTNCKNLFLHATSGTIHLQIIEENLILKTGALLIIENISIASIYLNSAEDSAFAVVQIF